MSFTVEGLDKDLRHGPYYKTLFENEVECKEFWLAWPVPALVKKISIATLLSFELFIFSSTFCFSLVFLSLMILFSVSFFFFCLYVSREIYFLPPFLLFLSFSFYSVGVFVLFYLPFYKDFFLSLFHFNFIFFLLCNSLPQPII